MNDEETFTKLYEKKYKKKKEKHVKTEVARSKTDGSALPEIHAPKMKKPKIDVKEKVKVEDIVETKVEEKVDIDETMEIDRVEVVHSLEDDLKILDGITE